MVDTLRRGTRAAETIMGGIYGGASYNWLSDGMTAADIVAVMGLTVVLMGLYVALGWYYERRRGQPL